MYLARTGLFRRFMHSAFFHFRYAGRNAYDNARMQKASAVMYFTYKVLYHFLRYIKIRYNSVPQGTESGYVCRSAAKHFLGLTSDSENFSPVLINSNH